VKPYKDIDFDKVVCLNKYNVVYLSKINIRNIRKNIKILQPDIIYLNSFFSKMTQVVLFLKLIKLIKNKIILAPRGELSHGALSLKSKKKKVFLSVAKIFRFHSKDLIFHATDKIERFDIERLFPNKVVEIPNLINNKICEFNNFKKETGALNIVFLSRISEKKNLLYALKILQAVGNKNIVFDIYGPKEDLEYWKKCKQVINSLSNIKISYKGSACPDDISTILSNYQCFFLPTLNENFGHAIVEAMQIGLVPIISNQTPWIDLQKYDAGWSLNLNDKLSFINAFDILYEMDNERFQVKSQNIRKYIKLKLDNKDSVDLYKNMFYFE
jgi:glycosyltransferase involved in cell wall biosynthesis